MRRPPDPAPDATVCAAQVLDTVPGVMDAMRRAMRRHVEEDTSVPQFRCMNFVARQPRCSIGDVAAFLGVTMPTASAMVDRLVRAGLLQARADDVDRRRSRLDVTVAGRARLARMRRGAQRDFAVALAACDSGELATIDAAMTILRRVLREA